MAQKFEQLFPLRGELSELIRSKDWDQTPLGPPAGWSPSLHTVLRLMLASRYAMWLGWGADLTFFYNDEYALKTLGPKHPTALGLSVREVWSEIWDTLRVRIDHVLSTGEATWDEGLLLFLERNGYPEETYHTFSYSPAPGDSPGEVGGLFCVVIEETERVIGERHIGLLREFASLLNEAKTAEKDVFSAVERSLAGSRDVPFALTYLFENDGASARLVARTTVEDGHAAAPARVGVDSALWPFLSIASESAPVVVELSTEHRWPNGPWERPPTRALVLPIAHQGHSRPAGVFIAGLNPHRPLDSSSRSFVELFVGQLSAGLSNARAYEEERKRSEALAALDQAKTAFFSNISHEFRTPLTLMIGPAEEALADTDEPLGPRQHERLELVHRNALRLGKLVNNLLDFARIEAGRVESSYIATDLAMATRELASIFQSAMDRAGLRLDLTAIEPIAEPVYVDRDQWEKIVLNLISNALKFTFEGSIRVGLRLVDDVVELTVADTGIGVDATEIPRLFERFHRIRGARSRTHEGTGIGLALVQELARLHGGSVSATSELGKGTTFFVRIKRGREHLPAERVEARTASAVTSIAAVPFVEEALRWLPGDPATNSPPAPLAVTLAASLSAVSEPRARVLIADDNQDMRNHLVRLLSGRYTVESVADGAEALRSAKETRPDLVLADVMMPNMDGFELVRALRHEESTRDLPVMLLSARAGEEATREGLEAGADDYLVKPFSARELGARVDAQISRGRLRAAETAHRKYITSVFESAPVGIAILHGPEHAFAFVNARYLALIPHKRAQDIVGLGIRAALPELVGQGIYEILDNAYRAGEPYLARSFRLELPRGKDGAVEIAFFDFEYQPIRNPDGAIDGIVVVVYEVTELANARAEAEAANRAKDEFLAMLGHELRNPLAPIMTALELMELRGNAVRERTIIDRQVRHLLRLVDDLLDVSRITRDKIILSRESLDIAVVIADAIETASPMFERQAHRLRVTAPPGTLFVHGDRVRLSQVLANLLTNAAKYTDAGGEIEVTADAADDAVVLRVRDNGQGLSPDLLPRVFDLFTQGTRTIERSQGGLGLGLAIVKNLIAAHGGTVSAASEGVGQGSVFTVSLPRITAPPHVETTAPERATATTATTSLRVLVVDDNEDGADLLDEVLRSMGHTTRVAHDGLEALGAAAEFKPDVALIDIGLPVMDGYEVAAKLRETLDPGLRLIAVTGYGQASDRARALAAGFDHHLVKPVELDKLLALLERRP